MRGNEQALRLYCRTGQSFIPFRRLPLGSFDWHLGPWNRVRRGAGQWSYRGCDSVSQFMLPGTESAQEPGVIASRYVTHQMCPHSEAYRVEPAANC